MSPPQAFTTPSPLPTPTARGTTPTLSPRRPSLPPPARRRLPRRSRTPTSTVRAPPAPQLAPQSSVPELRTTTDFLSLQRHAAAERTPLLVLFHADHCRVCRYVLPKFRELGENAVRARFATVKYSEARELAMRLGVSTVPFLHVYEGGLGKVEARSCGLKALPWLRDFVERIEGRSWGEVEALGEG